MMKENGTAVSVIMPVHNGEKYLKNSILSVLDQSLKNIELICIDDGSTDRSFAILSEMREKDSRIVICQQANKGCGAARNLALQKANGTYAVFMDCDDFYPSSTTLETLFTAIQRENVMICGGSFSWYIDREIRTDFPDHLKPYVFNEAKIMKYSDYQFDYGFHRFIYNMDFLRKNDIFFPDLLRFQDVPFFIKAMITAGEFYTIPDITYCYRKACNPTPAREWTSRKYRDVLKGIAMSLKMSREAGLSHLHVLAWKHFFVPNYYAAFTSALYRHNYETVSLFFPLLAETDFSMLRKENVPFEQQITELKDSVNQCLNDCQALKEEIKKAGKVQSGIGTPEIAVSVIMPSLNVEPYIRQCVESVIKQKLKNIEILCVDAGSTDGTFEILKEYASVDPRIRVISSARKSYGYQVNLGISEAKGRYIAIVETDDCISPDMFSSLYEKAVKENLEVVKSDYTVIWGDGCNQEREIRNIVVSPACYNRVISGNELIDLLPRDLNPSMYIWAGLYKTDFLKSNHICCQETPGASYQDNGFWFTLLMYVQRMMFVNQPFYFLRRDNPNSSFMAANKANALRDECNFIDSRIEELKNEDFKKKYKRLFVYYRFKKYLFACKSMSVLDHLAFLKSVSEEFLLLEARGELDFSIFKPDEHKQLAAIMTDPTAFFVAQSAMAKPPRPSPGRCVLIPQTSNVMKQSLIRKCAGKIGFFFLYWETNGFPETVKKVIRAVKRRVLH